MKKVIDFLRSSQVYYLATTEGDQPKVRPFGAVAEFEGKIYFCTGNFKSVYKQLLANPKVEFSAMSQDGKWIRLWGAAVFDERIEAKQVMLDANPSLNDIYKLDDGVFEVFYLKNAGASIESFITEKEEIKL